MAALKSCGYEELTNIQAESLPTLLEDKVNIVVEKLRIGTSVGTTFGTTVVYAVGNTICSAESTTVGTTVGTTGGTTCEVVVLLLVTL